MATFDYTEIQAVAEELISEFGQQGAVSRRGQPDPIEGGDPASVLYPATLVPMAYAAREIDGTIIQVGDVQVYVSAVGLAITPSPGDTVSVNGKEYRIINSDPNVYDGQTAVVHICQCRI